VYTNNGDKMRKLRIDRIIIAVAVLILFIALIIFLISSLFSGNKMVDLTDMSLDEIKEYAEKYKLNLNVVEQYNKLEEGKVISQSIAKNTKIKSNDNLDVVISKGLDYNALGVDELGNVPIMMYHGIHDITDNEYTGGNVDKDGYQRTSEAFRNDLEFYYQNGYRMIRLEDYINGIVDVEAGYSPIIITFDDGLSNAIKVTGLNDDGSIIIDPQSAVGILEEFKAKYPDFNVTATFFVNGGLFNQSEYNEKILNYLIDNGYDIGNHTYSHVDFTTVDSEKSVKEVGSLYNLLDKYIQGKYVNIVALPFGSPYKKTHENFSSIMSGTYEGKSYNTVATLRVGWEAEYSCFNVNFDKTFLKRIRAYDNNGNDFDIEYNFKVLENNRYISDGDKNTITIPSEKLSKLNNNYNLEVITY
jgi:hypothetical protein